MPDRGKVVARCLKKTRLDGVEQMRMNVTPLGHNIDMTKQQSLLEKTAKQMSTPSASEIREVAVNWLNANCPEVGLGLPEYDDRMRVWRVAMVAPHNGRETVGELRIINGKVVSHTDISLASARAKTASPAPATPSKRRTKPIQFPPIPSMIAAGDARVVLSELPPDTAQLIFTSPPYFNAKPECHESTAYADYLDLMREVFELCAAVLSEGRFLVVNTSPVLVRRPSRSASSRRLAIPFDLHNVLTGLGFEFIDDIIWRKPEGAGWHLGRGRRFAADRQPLQYKPVTVTEYLMVYRFGTDQLIDWNIRNHPDPEAVKASLIEDGYERTNVWDITPARHKAHPAVFPEALAERVIRYYSFERDLVLDPFGGTGTTGRVASRLNRRFALIDNSLDCFNIMASDPELSDARKIDIDYIASCSQ